MPRVSQVMLLVLALAPWTASAQNYFGAIAYSVQTGSHGWANNHPSRAAAERAAVASCGKFAKDCKIAVWFSNACAALATNPKRGFGSGWGETQAIADGEAMKACTTHSPGCFVKYRVCSAGKS